MKIYYTTYSVGGGRADGSRHTNLVVERWPLWAAVLETVVCQWFCALTGHRFCFSRPLEVIDRFTWRRVERFELPVAQAELVRYLQWRRGWSPWWLDDEEDEA